MNVLKTIHFCFCMLLAMITHCYAQDWRNIQPLHSTCEDVKRILGGTECRSSSYVVEDGKVNIDISEKPCVDGWNVPPGTVLSVTFYPKEKRLSDLGLDLTSYKKMKMPDAADYDRQGWLRYINEEEAIAIEVRPDETVYLITYSPKPKDNYLRYPDALVFSRLGSGSGGASGATKFDEYSNLSLQTENKRLDVFASQLKAEPEAQANIIVYGGRRSCAQEALSHSNRIKHYLVSTHAINSSRILTVDGGYREEPTVELFINRVGGSGPIPSPTVCPSEVQIINCKDKESK